QWRDDLAGRLPFRTGIDAGLGQGACRQRHGQSTGNGMYNAVLAPYRRTCVANRAYLSFAVLNRSFGSEEQGEVGLAVFVFHKKRRGAGPSRAGDAETVGALQRAARRVEQRGGGLSAQDQQFLRIGAPAIRESFLQEGRGGVALGKDVGPQAIGEKGLV